MSRKGTSILRKLIVVGGIYHESCIWPEWDQIYGSAGRAASAAVRHVERVELVSRARVDIAQIFAAYASSYGFDLRLEDSPQTLSFDYVHSLSSPSTRPAIEKMIRVPDLEVRGDVVLRFGMVECSAIVNARCCIYDPQFGDKPEHFSDNGSFAERLAIVANQSEVRRMGNAVDATQAAQNLLGTANCEVVVVKAGPDGAIVVDADGVQHISAYRTAHVWKVGSGDVFASIFASRWGVHGENAVSAADIASRAVATYVESMSLPVPDLSSLMKMKTEPTALVPGKVYLAGPFFTMQQRWLVDETRRCLTDFNLEVFSPFHEVGMGTPSYVATADLSGLEECDRVFALLDGLDCGTLFELGYARAKGIPVYAFSQVVSEADLKMIVGSDCRVFDDFTTAIHHTGWRS